MIEDVTVVIPSYNTQEYLKLAYESIRRYYEKVRVIIIDDASEDGTAEFLTSLEDPYTTIIFSNERRGHTFWYDYAIAMSSTRYVTILHSDMVIGKNYLENMVKHCKKGVVVCSTRVEPPIHPEGNEKVIRNFGMYPKDFKLNAFDQFVEKYQNVYKYETTRGIFAPWLIMREDFLQIRGHDQIFAPFGYEDSDIFNRWCLNGYQMVQSRDSFVYHFTCRGHRWNSTIGVNNSDYKHIMERCRRDYIRKWGGWILNDKYQHPIITPKFDIAIGGNLSAEDVFLLEPWCSAVYLEDRTQVLKYHTMYQQGTSYDLTKRVLSYPLKKEHGIFIDIGSKDITSNFLNIMHNLPQMLSTIQEVGSYTVEDITIQVNDLTQYQDTLILNTNIINHLDKMKKIKVEFTSTKGDVHIFEFLTDDVEKSIKEYCRNREIVSHRVLVEENTNVKQILLG